MDDNGIPKSFIAKAPKFQIESRTCVSGEEQTPEGTCQKCTYGFYLIQPPDREMACRQCDVNAQCFGENLMAPRPGYFRSSNTSEDILACYSPSACLGGV
jgi:hypothetical protein